MTENSKLLSLPGDLLKSISDPFVGREEEAKTIVLALLSREHLLLIGEPGTAKSALVRRASSLIKARFFKYLLTRYTEPSELFGPLDIVALQQGEYKRITANKLPEAEIAFLDEIFNANSAILNTLLTLLQERIIYDGYTELRVPLWCLFAATNRVPDDPELDALYDRFTLRHKVSPVPENKWDKLLEASWKLEIIDYMNVPAITTLKDIERIHHMLFKVNIENIKNKLFKILAVLEDKGLHLSDRRKGKALKIIAAHALLNGRLEAIEEDLMALKYVAPSDPDDFERVNIILSEELKTTERIIRELNEIENNLRDVASLIEDMKNYDPRLIEIYRSLKITRNRVLGMQRDVENENIMILINDILVQIDKLLARISSKLGM